MLFARSAFFRLHSAILAGALFAAVLGVIAAVIGGVGAYASIYAVNNYFERLIGSHGTVITILGGGLVGVIGMIAALFITLIVFVLAGGLLSALTGSSVDIPIFNNWNMPTGFSLHIWTPGDVDGAGEGGLGCMAALSPGFLVAPFVGAFAGIRLQNGNPLDISFVPWVVALICCLLVGFIGLLGGIRTGWVEGGDKFGGVIVGALYGFLAVRMFGDDFGLNHPAFLRIITYIVGIVLFASIGHYLAPDHPEDTPKIILYTVTVIALLAACGLISFWLLSFLGLV